MDELQQIYNFKVKRCEVVPDLATASPERIAQYTLQDAICQETYWTLIRFGMHPVAAAGNVLKVFPEQLKAAGLEFEKEHPEIVDALVPAEKSKPAA